MATECISKYQFNYVCVRIDDICNAALDTKMKELTTKKEHYVNDEEAEKIFTSICKEFKVKNSYHLRHALDFSRFENDEEYDKETYEKFRNVIIAEANDFKDRIMLCGAGDVLEELKEFEKKYLSNSKGK